MATDTAMNAISRSRVGQASKTWAKWRVPVYRIAMLTGFLLFWEFAVQVGWAKVYFYGQPSGILNEFIARLTDGRLARDTAVTSYEAIAGFLIGGTFGSLFGLALWLSPTMSKILHPIIIAMNGFPKIALAPLLIVWFGIGYESKIAIAAIITFLVALITAAAGTKEIDEDLIRLLRTLGASRWQTFIKVVLPGSIPWIVSGFRLNVGFALIGAVSGEYIASSKGLGYMIYHAGQTYELNAIWTGIIALMALAMFMDKVVALFEARFKKG